MSLDNLYLMDAINDKTWITIIIVNDEGKDKITSGYWYNDNILKYLGWKIDEFIGYWKNDNKLSVRIKE